MKAVLASIARLLALVLLCGLALQLYFLARVLLMVWVDPQSTTYQRSEAWRLLTEKSQPAWSQRWVAYGAISDSLKRAVIASEDAGFSEHSGIEWDAIEKAWERNLSAEARAERANQRRRTGKIEAITSVAQARIVGGSTITQQLAKTCSSAASATWRARGRSSSSH